MKKTGVTSVIPGSNLVTGTSVSRAIYSSVLPAVHPAIAINVDPKIFFPKARTYGFVLNSDETHPITSVLRTRWSAFHYYTGEDIALVVFQTPDKWPSEIEEYWRKKLGTEFAATWDLWKRGDVDPGAAYKYTNFFGSTEIDPSQMPCLVLYTEPDTRNAIVRSLPKWDVDSEFAFMMHVLSHVRRCNRITDRSERLECLRQRLTSPQAIFKSTIGHIRDRAVDYCVKHPAQLIVTALTAAASLATGGALPMGPAGVEWVKATKDAAQTLSGEPKPQNK